MTPKFWQTLFHIGWVLASVLLPLATHNASVNDGTAPMWEQLLGIHGAGLTGILSAFAALVSHHKVAALKAAEVPKTVTAESSRENLCDLLWSNIGVAANEAEIAAIKTLKGGK